MMVRSSFCLPGLPAMTAKPPTKEMNPEGEPLVQVTANYPRFVSGSEGPGHNLRQQRLRLSQRIKQFHSTSNRRNNCSIPSDSRSAMFDFQSGALWNSENSFEHRSPTVHHLDAAWSRPASSFRSLTVSRFSWLHSAFATPRYCASLPPAPLLPR